MRRATPAMSPISIASVFSISSSLLLLSSTQQNYNENQIEIHFFLFLEQESKIRKIENYLNYK